VKTDICNVTGTRIATLTATAPGQVADWNAAGVAPGIYFCRVTLPASGADQKLPVKKLALIKP
jgi:hypothetical protein